MSRKLSLDCGGGKGEDGGWVMLVPDFLKEQGLGW